MMISKEISQQDKLQQMEQTLIAGMPGGMAIYRIKKNGKIKTDYVSQSLANMCGYEGDEFLEYLREDAIVNLMPEDIPFVTEAVNNALENKENLSVIYHIYKKDRTPILIRLDAKTIETEDKEDDDIAVLYAIHTLVSDKSKKIITEQTKLSNLVERVPAGLGIYEIKDGTVEQVYMNEAFYSMINSTREKRSAYYRGNVLLSSHPEDRVQINDAVKKIMAGEDKVEFEYRIKTDDGDWFWIHISVKVVDRNDDLIRAYGSFTDYNKVKEFEYKAEIEQQRLKKLYENQIRYTKMLSADAVASALINLTTKTISLENVKDEKMMDAIKQGTPKGVFEAISMCIPDEELKIKYAEIFNRKAVFENFKRGISSNALVHPYLDYDYWLESSYHIVENPTTRELEIYCIAKDVSKTVLQNTVSSKIISQSYDDVILIDAKTGKPSEIQGDNNNKLYEVQRNEGDYSKGLEDYILANCADENPKAVAKSLGIEAVTEGLENNEIYTVPYSMYAPDGSIIHRTATYVYLNKYKMKFLCAIQNVTKVLEKETRQREALKKNLDESNKASNAKAEFYSRMSHDMRTPMNGILGMTSLSEDEDDINVLKNNIKKIKESGEYLLNLINDTLDIQRIESRKMVLEPSIVDIKDVLDNILDMVQVAANEKNVKIECNQGNVNLKNYVRLDSVRVKQIFVNLLSNAVKFSHPGGTVHFDFNLISREGMISHDVVYVRDSGMGMSKEFLENGIFKPFSQESNEVSTMYAGSGLGLSIAKSLVELMGGRIEVKSELGVGTEFAVYLDFERIEESEFKDEAEKNKLKKEKATGTLKGKRILLVEDHPLNAEISKKLLAKAGCEVVWKINGQEAVDCFMNEAARYFDGILMDIRMPVMDGLEATRAIRKSEKADAKDIPIIAMTANAYADDVKKTVVAGMNAHIAKPIDTDKFFDVLEKMI